MSIVIDSWLAGVAGLMICGIIVFEEKTDIPLSPVIGVLAGYGVIHALVFCLFGIDFETRVIGVGPLVTITAFAAIILLLKRRDAVEALAAQRAA